MSVLPSEASTDLASDSVTYVVGIGASAGGLEALEHLFRHVPTDTGMAFVVVQHLSPDFKSQMDELLRRWTTLPVGVATHEQRLEPNTVVLIPPNAELIASKGRLLLEERGKGLPLPIDRFLCSLADDMRDRAIAVVLSGTGSDGSRGIREIHDAGGVVIVQSEETAKFDGMPKSAIETGAVDLVLPPAEIGAALVRHRQRRAGERIPEDDPSEAVESGGMPAVYSLLRERYGVDFSAYKPGTIGRRTERRLLLNHTPDLGEYLARLRSDRSELDALYHDLLIGVTQFFRDPDAFGRLERDVLPQLVSEVPRGRELRIWVAGCATGEEAYSLAILVTEAIERAGHPISAKIFATDVHRASLDVAGAGSYPPDALEAMDPARLERFFVADEHGYRVTTELRRMIVFAPHNVIQDAPFTKLDLITCRNLLIYFQPAVQRKVLSLFHFGLRTGGVLFLGPSESPAEIADELDTIDPHAKLYRKRRDVRLLPGLRTSPLVQLPPAAPNQGSRSSGSSDAILLAAFGTVLDQTLPPSVLLDHRRQVLHTFGDVSPLLRLPRGRPSLGLLDMLEGELKLAVAGALHRASRSREAVRFTGVRRSGNDEHLDLHVTPLTTPHSSEPMFLVSLQRSAQPPPEPAHPTDSAFDLPSASRDRLDAVELELQHTKENLQATIEELEASNEELQSTNEELLASNEELQSTNEELHSVNEELYTVNAELQRRIEQLIELTDDMDNLLLSTEVHTLFLDHELCIRKFTPAIAETFHLVEGDVGRRIDGFVHTIAFEGLVDVLGRTLETGERFEQEVGSRDGTAYLLRIMPYRGRGARNGVVLTLTDITRLREVELALREQVLARDHFLAILSHELRNPLAAINNALTLIDRRIEGARGTPEALTGPLQLVARQSRHMQRLLDDLLDVSRVTQGKIRLREELFELGELVRELVVQVQPAMDRHQHAFAMEVGTEPIWILGDRARILQVIDNLLTNAIKYTPDGGHVVLRLGSADGRARVEVEDDGTGIDAPTREHIFEMFVQADVTIDRSRGGLGVGLTLVHQLVGMHQGAIEVHSEGRNRGSRFVVWLPRAEAPAGIEPAAARANEPSTRTALKLVVVEDREEIRESLAELLRDDGYQVLTANDGAEGLRLIQRERPIAALLDIGLPGLDGYEIARQVRGTPALAETRLVAMTGYGTDEDKLRVERAGFDAHIVKPFFIENVLGALEKLGVQG